MQAIGTDELISGEENHVLFMQGHPSPSWLNAIGAKYRIDPEFWLQHLDFRASVGRPDHFSLPGLPSKRTHFIRLRSSTIGHRDLGARFVDQRAVDKLRDEAAQGMKKYFRALKRASGWQVGDMIVREFSVLDGRHSMFEQDISIFTKEIGHGWIAVIWSDCGTPVWGAPWYEGSFAATKWMPTVQYWPDIALEESRGVEVPAPPGSMVQSAQHLPYLGDQLKDTDLARRIPALALEGIFSHVAASESQVLNLLQTKIDSVRDPKRMVEEKNPTLLNLLHYQRIIERHLDRIKENLTAVEKFIESVPRTDVNETQKTTATVILKALLEDFAHLKTRAEYMLGQCNGGMTIIMNNAMLRESQRAIEQAATVTKLTKLAFVFIPLSFVCAFFGMNSREIDNGQLSIWVFFAVAMPIVLLSILMMQVEKQQIQRLAAKCRSMYKVTRNSEDATTTGPKQVDTFDLRTMSEPMV
ncbi:uncharacterized protein RHO25_012228 [Cercospora beticola]|nr:hypothetical protein RHO25_012228 [Cercospora beticola]